MREFKKPDLTAPRFRPEVYNVLSEEFFDNFRKKHPKYAKLTNAVLKKIAKTFNQHVYSNVIDTRDGVQLPEQIGWLFIGTCQQSKKYNVDFNKSKTYGVQVSNNNFATDGKLAKIFYSNYAPKHKIRNREFWTFIACRDFKRSVAKTYPENWNIYVVVENGRQVKLTYNKEMYKDKKAKEQSEALKTYNEFDL
jgi:hypothetical protein